MDMNDLLAGAVPGERVVTDRQSLGEYARAYTFSRGAQPLLALQPIDKAEVQAIVRQANVENVPLVPVSSGPSHFHGGSRPVQGGVMVDFRRMNRVLRINVPERYVMVEPGVTYGELMPAVRSQGLRLDAPLLPRAAKSVVASRLEREPVTIPKYQYDYSDPLLTVEVIYGNGEEFRTGSASGPGPLETLTADKVNPWGPGAIDYLRFITGAQGTMGLVTWAVTKAEILPDLQRLYFVPADDPAVLAELMNRLLRKRVGDECLALNNVGLAARLAERWPDDFAELRASLPPWTALVVLAGYKRHPEERLSIQEKYLAAECAALGLTPSVSLRGAAGREEAALDMLGRPDYGEPYWKLRPRGSVREIFYLSPFSKVAHLATVMERTRQKAGFAAEDLGAYIQPCVQGRGCHSEFDLFFDETDSQETELVRELFFEASRELMAQGAFFSRPYGPWAPMVYEQYGEGVAALRKLKDIFDPKHILNPGKLCF
jgi:FAD/FMN-containing dehydrogenase